MIPFAYGPILGFVIGFFITLAKSPPFIVMDCVYGAMLGFLLVLTINIFYIAFAEPEHDIVNTTPETFKSRRAQALYREMELDRLRYEKARHTTPSPEISPSEISPSEIPPSEPPISSRTRSRRRLSL
jgi:hypothetical protein